MGKVYLLIYHHRCDIYDAAWPIMTVCSLRGSRLWLVAIEQDVVVV